MAFDFGKSVSYTGVVKSFAAINPHMRMVLELKNADGKGTHIVNFEGHSTNNMYRAGYRKGMVKVGDTMTVNAAPYKDGTEGGYVISAKMSDGTVLRHEGPRRRHPAADRRRSAQAGRRQVMRHSEDTENSMARIIGGIATSHTPTIGFALDAKKQEDPVWKPIFEGYKPVQQWLADRKPDVLLYIFNDHITSFFLDHYSHFALGIGEEYAPADEGGGPRKLPAIQGDPKLAAHIAAGLVADEFDLSYFQGKNLDHGVFSPLSLLLPHENSWPCRMVPFQCGVLNPPVPTPLRFYKLGLALRKAILSLSGGHQGRHRRHGWPVAPGAWRALRLQQHALGHGVHRAPGEGPGRPRPRSPSPSTPRWAAWKAPKS